MNRGASGVLGTCRWASMSGSTVLRFHFSIYRIRQLDLLISVWGLADLWSAKNSVWRQRDLLYSKYLSHFLAVHSEMTIIWIKGWKPLFLDYEKKMLALCYSIPSLSLIPPSCVALTKSHCHSQVVSISVKWAHSGDAVRVTEGHGHEKHFEK